MLGLWQYTKGYVRLCVKGFTIERFLNMAAFKGIYIWDVERTESGVELNVSIKGFKMLKTCARKTKCRTKIIEKNGFPFVIHKYRKRKLLIGGVLFFILGLFMLSSFIWRIEIEGNDMLTEETVLAFLSENGLYTGALKFRFDDRELRHAILTYFPEIVWADVHTRGTRTTVLLTEALPQPEIIDRNTPVHVVALSEGLITGIVTGAGAPLVRQNDIVREGEMLVSGILELDPDMPGSPNVYVHAEAEIWARRYHNLEFSVPFMYEEKVFTGETSKRRSLQLLFGENRRITLPMGTFSYESYDRKTIHNQIGANGNFPMPFVMVTDLYLEYVPESRTRTLEEAMDLAERMVTNRILREFDFGIDIINRQLSFAKTEDALIVSALITTSERIDKQVPITVPTPGE